MHNSTREPRTALASENVSHGYINLKTMFNLFMSQFPKHNNKIIDEIRMINSHSVIKN